MALFESYERRIKQIDAVLNSYGIASIEEAEKITKDAGLDVYNQVKGIQPIGFGAIAATASRLGSGRMVRKKAHRLYRMKEYTTNTRIMAIPPYLR